MATWMAKNEGLKGVFISLFKFAQVYIEYMDDFFTWEEDKVIDFIACYCVHEKRKGRKNT